MANTAIRDLITSVRYKIVDPDATNFSDAELLSYFQDAHVALHGLVAERRPKLIEEKKSGKTETGVNTISWQGEAYSKIKVRINGYLLTPLEEERQMDATITGEPLYFEVAGFTSIEIYPTPDNQYNYELSFVPQPTALLIDGTSPWPVSFDPYLVEYAAVRAGMRDEADMNQEASFMMQWSQKIKDALDSMAPSHGRVLGYW